MWTQVFRVQYMLFLDSIFKTTLATSELEDFKC